MVSRTGQATGKQCSVFGYTFDVNPALTSAWLHQLLVGSGVVLDSTTSADPFSLTSNRFLFWNSFIGLS